MSEAITPTQEQLRDVIERPQACRFWGREYVVTPQLISRVFGDGALLVCVFPLAARPNYFVARVDSSTKDVRDPIPGSRLNSLLDEIVEAAEDDNGHLEDEDEDFHSFPVVDWGIGCSWSEPFPISEWSSGREEVQS